MQKDNYEKLYNQIYEIVSEVNKLFGTHIGKFDYIKKIIIAKIFSNLDALMCLIQIKNYNEAKIIIRSMIESVVLFVYYSTHPESEKTILNDCNLLRFKNAFCCYCLFHNSPKKIKLKQAINLGHNTIEEEEKTYISELEKCYKGLSADNKAKLLKVIERDKFILDTYSIENLKKFFSKFKPIMLTLQKLLNELENEGILVDDEILNIKSGIYEEYNEFSQVSHGNIGHWYDVKNDYRIYSTPIRLLFIMLEYSKGIIPVELIREKLEDKTQICNDILDTLMNDCFTGSV